jgi:YD repeat-containing protein
VKSSKIFILNAWQLIICLSLLLARDLQSQLILTNFVSRPIMACGSQHVLMLKSDGTVWTWGINQWVPNIGNFIGTASYNNDGQFGQTGQNEVISTVPPTASEYQLYYYPGINLPPIEYAPYSVNSLNLGDGGPALRETNILGAVSVAAGDFYSLVLKWNGTVLAFGHNNMGQLGIGNTIDTSHPTPVANLASVAAISAGYDFSMAVSSNGTVQAWGDNGSGQLGIGNKTSMTVPANVIGLSNIVMVSCGYQHSLALSTNGTVWAWGDNSYGELGNGTITSSSTPVMVTNLSGVALIAAGTICSMAVLTNGTVKAWGYYGNDNISGGLGLGTNTGGIYTNQPIPVPGLNDIRQISIADSTGFAVDKFGQLWGWGQFGLNYYRTPVYFNLLTYQLGTLGGKSTTTSLYTPSGVYPGYNAGMLDAWGRTANEGIVNWDYSDYISFVYNYNSLDTNVDWGYEARNAGPVEPNALYRGSSSLADFASFVIPLDFEKGVALTNLGGVATNLLPFVTNYATGYQYNYANSGTNGQTNLALRIPYQNPIAAFGSRVGGSPLFTGQSYRFAIFGGCPTMINDYPMLTNYNSALQIEVYAKSNYALIAVTNFAIPFYLGTNNNWASYMTNGVNATLSAYGLSTTLSTLSYPNAYGVVNNGPLQLAHLATAAATNYVFVVKYRGMNWNGWMSLDGNDNPVWQPLYTLEFQSAPPWNISFLSQVQFQGSPLPPFYDGKSLPELLTNSWIVNNVVNVPNPIASYTNLDDSPELRRHPILDTYVSQLKNDPLAIARFVQNEIDLTDAIDWQGTSEVTSGAIDLGGVNRGALGTFLERQGSPMEQCSLLVYMLRQAGVPAVYAFPPTNGIKMLDARLSKMLRVQLNGTIDPYYGSVSTNSLIAVNYPWVAAYINNQWVHLFPWIKDTEIIQGPNLYDYMPTNYNNAMKWILGYLNNRPEIVGLGDTNDAPETLFPRYVEEQLLTNAPGVSFDELGVQAVNRPHVYATWSDFPTPTWVAGTNWVAESLSDPVITNPGFATWNPSIPHGNNIFNTADIQVNWGVTNLMDTLTLRLCDLHDRTFLVYGERTNAAVNPNGPVLLKMKLAAYRPGITNISGFTNDANLLNNELQSIVLTPNSTASAYGSGLTIQVTLNQYSTLAANFVQTRIMPIAQGNLNAICLNYGRVSEEMLEPLAQNIWNVENQIQQTPSITNSLTADQYQGPLMYLMGMSYYQKVDHFIPVNAQIHGLSPVEDFAVGLAKLICKMNSPNTSTPSFPSGPMIYNQPAVDMEYYHIIMGETLTARPDSGVEPNNANNSFSLLEIVDASAKEHVAINQFFNQADAISTVRLLQLTAQRYNANNNNSNIVFLNYNNFAANAVTNDMGIWNQVLAAVINSPESQALMTPYNTTNNTGSYSGIGALVINNNGTYAALISGAGNGGWGEDMPDNSFADDNLADVSLDDGGDGNYSVDFTEPSVNYQPLAPDDFDPFTTLDVLSQANNNFLQFTPFDTSWTFQSASFLGDNISGINFNNAFASSVLSSQNSGFLGFLSDALSQFGSAVKDPVHVVTGEFYVDTVDLSLVGPLPLEIRRNYSSLNLANNEFGTGWKLSFTPYISVATNGAEMYAAEPDGSVLAYTRSATNGNLWIATTAQNPQLVNNRKQGIGSTANLFLTRIVQTNQSGITNYFLYSPNGDLRTYLMESFSISNVISRTRPYLTTWRDARGNALYFSYGTNSQATDYGQLARVDSSSGAYVQFAYDIYGHILRAFSNDGREVDYQYDDYGDLMTVTLPDASEINYQYGHGYQPVTNNYTANGQNYTSITEQVYSFHLLTTKTDPDGRILENTYDSQRRVVAQAATAGVDGSLVTNATFVYLNNFVLTNAVTNTISGSTRLADVFGNVTVYNYTNSRITLITDPLQQTIEQDWYDENPELPGYYPRSLWRTKDKRGLWTSFQYDAFGNVTNTITTGNLTGQGATQTATNITFYNSNNLPVITVDSIGNSNVFAYDPVFTFLPGQLVAYRQGQAITTNAIVYGNSTNVVTFGSAVWTNRALGLPLSLVRAFSSGDAATNQWFYNGSGFATNEIDYTSTTDPAINKQLFYDGRGELYQLIDAAGRGYTYDYDGLGRIITEEAFEAGQTIPMASENLYYDHNGDITWYDGPQYNPEDYVWFDYDGAGRKVSEVHWRSQAAANGSGVLVATNLYAITSYDYDPFGNLIEQVDPVGNYSVMAYDTIGQMTQQVFYNANNVPLATNLMSHEPGGEIANFTNSLGGVTQTLYTQTGKPYFRQNPDGSTNAWQYDLLGRVQKEILPNGSYWQTTYNDASRAVVRQFINSGGSLLAVTTNIFDRRGNLITNVTAQGAVFFNVYDGLNRLKVAGGPGASGSSAQQITYTYYDGAGVLVTNVDSAGRKTVTTFDATERPLSTQTYDLNNGGALIDSQTSSYSPDNHTITVTVGTGANAITKATGLDSYYNPVFTRAYPNATATNYSILSYDLNERVAASQDELGRVTALNYDGLGRVASKQLPDGATVVNSYNSEGDLTSMVMPGGLTWTATYSAAHQRIGEQLANANGTVINRQFTNVYYANGPLAGQLQSATDLGRAVTNTFSYDGFLRVASSSAVGTLAGQTLATTYQYDSGGEVTNYTQTSGTNPGTSVARAFDGYGQLTNEQIYIGGALQNAFAQGWDGGGRRNVLQSPAAAFSYSYRADGLMTGVIAFGTTSTFGYANNGLLASRSNPWRTLTVNARDGQGRLLQQTATVGSGNPLVETLAWQPDSTLASYSATRTGTGAWNDTRTYQYNARAQLTNEPVGVNSTTLATNNYTFDSSRLGVLVGAQWSGGVTNGWTGHLNSRDQITAENWNGAGTILWANGVAGNASSVSVSLDGLTTYNGLLTNNSWYANVAAGAGAHTLTASGYYPAGQFTNTATSSFTVEGTNGVTDVYDGAGYVTTRLFASGKTQALTWDAAGRLIGLTQWNNPTNGFSWTAIYDPLGRRLRTSYVPMINGNANPVADFHGGRIF